MSRSQSTRISGTREWAVKSVNCVNGCEHNCRYCYARFNACQRYGRIAPDQWPHMRIRQHDVSKRRTKEPGRVMFPSTHDITPRVLSACSTVLEKLLVAGNEVLVVSKPHLECIERLCQRLRRWRTRVLFRFTIGAISDSILSYWEPGAPLFEERFASLRHAHKEGYSTSVSCEPLLERERAVDLFRTLQPHVTDTIWFGCMNDMRSRVASDTSPAEIARIRAGQSKESILDLYAVLKDEPKVRWKESYKAIVGLRLAQMAGQDI